MTSLTGSTSTLDISTRPPISDAKRIQLEHARVAALQARRSKQCSRLETKITELRALMGTLHGSQIDRISNAMIAREDRHRDILEQINQNMRSIRSALENTTHATPRAATSHAAPASTPTPRKRTPPRDRGIDDDVRSVASSTSSFSGMPVHVAELVEAVKRRTDEQFRRKDQR